MVASNDVNDPHQGIGWALFDTPVGVCGLCWNGAGRLAGSQLPEADGETTRQRMQQRFGAAQAELPEFARHWITRLRAVMGGAADRLEDIPLADASAPAFQRRVWAEARQLAPGQTCSYGDMATALGDPGAARAVGRALAANPFAPFVPCHRVLAAGGRSGGFSAPGGRHTKLKLLELEGARFETQPGQASLF